MTTPPLPIEALTADVQLLDVRVADGEVVWLERRGGKGVLARWRGTPQDLTTGLDVGSSLGYGGGDFDVAAGLLVFVSGDVLWRQTLAGGPAARLTPGFGQADSPAVSPDGRWVAYVHREHDTDRLAIVDASGRAWPAIAAQGADFYSMPAWSPGGERLAWLEWDFPAMSWTSSRLMLARHNQGTLSSVEQVGGAADVAAYQPLFAPDGKALYFVDNEGERDRLVRLDLASGAREVLLEGFIMEPGLAQGVRSMCFGPGGALYVKTVRLGEASLVRVEPGGRPEPVPLGEYRWLRKPAGDGERLLAIAESPSCPPRLVAWRDGAWTPLRYASTERTLASPSQPSHLTIRAADGHEVHAVHYPALNGEPSRPKAVIRVHGGPTSMRGLGYDVQAQFLASRGYAFLDLNHRGSTGYGRSYREALDRNWGVVDVEDARAAADWLAEQGLASHATTAIMGGSAGGYTTLMSLATHPGCFGAGVSLAGVTDLLGLARRTHKLERRYLDLLVGPLPEALPTYRERSPITRAAAIRDPLYLFQGGQDKVVARTDADAFARELDRHGIAHHYVVYEEEGHMLSSPAVVEDMYRQIEAFLSDRLGSP